MREISKFIFMKTYLFAIILSALALMVITPSHAGNQSEVISSIEVSANDTLKPIDEPIPIIIKKIPADKDRSILPLSATYFDGSIELDFYSNLDTLYIVVVNSSTGERWSEYVETSEGYATIDISTAYYTGTYTINMYTQSSTYYTGTFAVE